GVRQVEEGRQQRAVLDAAGAGELGDVQDLLRGLFAVAGFEVDVGQRAVGGAEVDADGVAGGGHWTTLLSLRDTLPKGGRAPPSGGRAGALTAPPPPGRSRWRRGLRPAWAGGCR